MPIYNLVEKSITFRIGLFGPNQAGKRTTINTFAKKIDKSLQPKLEIFMFHGNYAEHHLEFSMPGIGALKSCQLKFFIRAAGPMVHRKEFLKSASYAKKNKDAMIFIANMEKNHPATYIKETVTEEYQQLKKETLEHINLSHTTNNFPLILQFNKVDISSKESEEKILNIFENWKCPSFYTSAKNDEKIFELITLSMAMAMTSLPAKKWLKELQSDAWAKRLGIEIPPYFGIWPKEKLTVWDMVIADSYIKNSLSLYKCDVLDYLRQNLQ